MFYAPKHSARRPHPVRRRMAGVGLASVATVGAGLAAPSSAQAGTVWDRVAECESAGNWSINTGNGFYGGLQFSYRTWKAFGGQRYAPTADRASKAQQITVAKKVLQVQGPGAWPHCSRVAGLTRANGGAVNPGSTATAASRSSARRAPAVRATRRVTRGWCARGRRHPRPQDECRHRTLGRPLGERQPVALGRAACCSARSGRHRTASSGRRRCAPCRPGSVRERNGARYLDRETVRTLQRYLNSH